MMQIIILFIYPLFINRRSGLVLMITNLRSVVLFCLPYIASLLRIDFGAAHANIVCSFIQPR
jgi:hypothetical protein